MDHIRPISTDPFGRNDIENLQLLCAECHEQKTVAQAWREPFNPLLSYFNEHTWSEFVLSARIPQTVCRYNRLDSRAPMQVVDAIRCRRQQLGSLASPKRLCRAAAGNQRPTFAPPTAPGSTTGTRF